MAIGAAMVKLRPARFALALSAAAVPLQALPAPAAQPSGALSLVAAHLKAVDTMSAAFAQTDRSGKTVTGTLALKKPGKIRFQYQKDVPILVVADGRALWFVDYSVRQVQRWPLSSAPLGVLLDPDKDLARVARIVPSADPRIVVVEARDPKRPEFGTITLAFSRKAESPGGLMLEGWTVIDSQSNRTTVRLTGQRFNVAMSDETFKWRDPRTRLGKR